MGDSGKPSGDWKSERISMTHLANFSRSSSYVRTLVRQQFHQSDQPSTAWERLRERLARNGSFDDYEEEMPAFLKKRESGAASNNEESNSDKDEEDDEEETYVYLKPANPSHRSSITADSSKPEIKNSNEENAETSSPSHENTSASSSRRLSALLTVPGSSSDMERRYTLASTDAHSKILNRRLSLAENVIKNYSKYIRTPDEPQKEEKTPVIIDKESAESDREPTNKEPLQKLQPTVAISEDKSSPLVDVKLVNSASPAFSHSSDFLAVPDVYSAGSSYTVPPSPAAENDTSFLNAPVRRNSFNGVLSEDFSLIRSVTDVSSVSTKNRLASDENKLPRISQTSKTRRKKLSAKSREEAIEKLREEHDKLAKNKRLNRRVGRKKETVYQQIQRDQERRARESAIFNREMEQITNTLQAINNRLDERIKALGCGDPPKVNAKLQRILQVALAGLPLKNM